MTTRIAITNQKGGVAKTTTCLSLAGCLCELGQTVLLIDMDPQANLTLSLKLEPDRLRRTVGDALLGNASLVSVSHECSVYGLDIVPANQELVTLDKVLHGRPNFQFRLRESLDILDENMYDFVLIDCPSSLGTMTLNGLAAADLLIIPIQCEYYAARTLRSFLPMIQRVQKTLNPDLAYRILVTMYDQRNKICRIIRAQMQEGLKDTLFSTIIEVDTKLRESPAFGKPITQYAPKTRGAEQYRALAKELMNHGG